MLVEVFGEPLEDLPQPPQHPLLAGIDVQQGHLPQTGPLLQLEDQAVVRQAGDGEVQEAPQGLRVVERLGEGAPRLGEQRRPPLGPLALGQIEHETDRRVRFRQQGGADHDRHPAAVAAAELLLVRGAGAGRHQLDHRPLVRLLPAGGRQLDPAQLAPLELPPAVAEHGEEGVVGAGDPRLLIGVVDAEDVGLEQALDPCPALPQGLEKGPLGF